MSYRKKTHLEPNRDTSHYRRRPPGAETFRQPKRMYFGVLAGCIIMLAGIFLNPLFGRELIMKGEFLLPVDTGEKSYPAEIMISTSKMIISCNEKVFRLFNRFELPFTNKLEAKIEWIRRLHIHKRTLYIIPEPEFHDRYRNIFHPVSEGTILSQKDNNAIIFEVDEKQELTANDVDFINTLRGEAHDFAGWRQNVLEASQ